MAYVGWILITQFPHLNSVKLFRQTQIQLKLQTQIQVKIQTQVQNIDTNTNINTNDHHYQKLIYV